MGDPWWQHFLIGMAVGLILDRLFANIGIAWREAKKEQSDQEALRDE